MEEEILQLEKKVAELTPWKEARAKERLTYPLDYSSRVTLNAGLIVWTGRSVNLDYLNLITNSMMYGYEVSINKTVQFTTTPINSLLLTLPIFPATANITTDFITNTQGQHNLNNGDRLTFTTDNQLPTPLDLDITYYVVNRTATTFQLSLTSGGSPIDMTFLGAGNIYYAKLL